MKIVMNETYEIANERREDTGIRIYVHCEKQGQQRH